MIKRLTAIRTTAFLTLLAAMLVLLYEQFGGVTLNVNPILRGVIVTGATTLILFETLFDKDMELVEPNSFNAIAGIVTVLLGYLVAIGYIFNVQLIVTLLFPFLNGIYVLAIVTLIWEYGTSMTGFQL